jgi:hypothetical protein
MSPPKESEDGVRINDFLAPKANLAAMCAKSGHFAPVLAIHSGRSML